MMAATWLLLILSTLFASAGNFQPPPQAFRESRFHGDCNGVNVNLRSEMPPIDDQLNSPWCNSFSIRALLEHYYRKQLNGQRLSVADINAIGSTQNPTNSRLRPTLTSGSNAWRFLTQIQEMGSVHLEENFPFDQQLFDLNGILKRIRTYYESQRPYAQVPGGLDCRLRNEQIESLERTFGSIKERLLENENTDTFIEKLQDDHNNFGLNPRAGAPRKNLHPPFDLDVAGFTTGDAYIFSLGKRLKEGNPVLLNLCGTQLEQLPSIGNREEVPPAERNDCGPHAVVAVGMKKIDGQCKVLLRNSWGNKWPKDGTGMAWVSTQELVGIVESPQSLAMASIRALPRGSVRPKASYVDDRLAYYGELKDTKFHGQGELIEENGRIARGRFENDVFVEGIFNGVTENGDHYDGEMRNGAFNGTGTWRLKSGQILRGNFENGQLMRGVLLEPIPNSNGRFREFQVSGGTYITNEFRVVSRNGTTVNP
jgi:hypothetical protein